MRRAGAILIILSLASGARAEVRLLVRPDGRKVIFNVGGTGRYSDYLWLAKQRNRASIYDPLIERYAVRYRVDPVLVRAVIQIESNFDPNCVSRKGARGLMQLMPGTALRYGVSSIYDPDQNIRGGVRYLADLLYMFNNDLRRSLAAYNAGEGAVMRYRGVPPYEETVTYVKRGLTVYHGRPWGEAESFPARRGGPRLRGGLVAASVEPIAILPGIRYLGAR